mmetsp:Transcript_40997/g.89335  ORF Transcript_40997/g.89335 Transcript_40997/m.89335 type:complete len:338 (-) Transcript_40997:156-1169(-)
MRVAVIFAGAVAGDDLPVLSKATIKGATVSGLSSGAFFATQMHVAHSSTFVGSAAVAGGPYYCARGSESTALTSCMTGLPFGPSGDNLFKYAQSQVSSGVIDDLANLKGAPVFLYTGTKDTTVKRKVVDANDEFFKQAGANITYETTIPSAHSMPTVNYGSECGHLGSPYINKCDHDTAGNLLTHLLGPLAAKATDPTTAGKFIQFDQSKYLPSSDSLSGLSLGNTGYAYIPSACEDAGAATSCKVHLVLHGCQQTIGDIQDQYVKDAGYPEWAATNNLVLIFPQAKKSLLIPTNPEGCWDWWGYSGKDYHLQSGGQMTTIMNMLKHVTGGTDSVVV